MRTPIYPRIAIQRQYAVHLNPDEWYEFILTSMIRKKFGKTYKLLKITNIAAIQIGEYQHHTEIQAINKLHLEAYAVIVTEQSDFRWEIDPDQRDETERIKEGVF